MSRSKVSSVPNLTDQLENIKETLTHEEEKHTKQDPYHDESGSGDGGGGEGDIADGGECSGVGEVQKSNFDEMEIENLITIFQAFDKQDQGCISLQDLKTIVMGISKNNQDSWENIKSNFNNGNIEYINFKEFCSAIKELEQDLERQRNTNPKKLYGKLLPKNHVNFLPDSKVVQFLSLLNQYRKSQEVTGNYSEARKARRKFLDLKEKEKLRQEHSMKQAHEDELHLIEGTQKQQFQQFSEAWDSYMLDYEATAYLSLEKLKEKHQAELHEVRRRIKEDYQIKYKFSKELIAMKKQVKKFVKIKEYEKAEQLENKVDIMENLERTKVEDEIEDVIERAEKRVRFQQQKALNALLKRIQRDREEQLKHRQIDSRRLIQRNKNVLYDLLNKQSKEERINSQFLNFALGVRDTNKRKPIKPAGILSQNNSAEQINRSRLEYSPSNPYSDIYRASTVSQQRRREKRAPLPPAFIPNRSQSIDQKYGPGSSNSYSSSGLRSVKMASRGSVGQTNMKQIKFPTLNK